MTEPHSDDLGLAGGIARAFITSPLSPLLFLACLGLGLLGLAMTPRQEDPQISVPMVDLFVSYPGASATQVETLVANPLERIMSEIPGVDHVYSVSRRGEALVTVQFQVGEVMEESLVKLNDKLQSNRQSIPPGTQEPLVKAKGVDDVPVVTLTLHSAQVDDARLRLIGLDVLQALSQVENTSQGFVVGGRSEQIRVEIQPEKLSSYGVGLQRIADTIRAANQERGVGHLEAIDERVAVYSGSFLRSAPDVARLIVGSAQGEPVYVRDIARVREGAEEASDLVTYYAGHGETTDQPAVTVAIAKKTGSNGVTVANAVLAELEGLKGRLIPDNVAVDVTRNYGATAKAKVDELILKLFIATGAVTLLVWGFLGRRAAAVVLLVIPVVILLTVFAAWILGYTIDRVSLFALIFSIGILVDDAIVVVENVYRRWLNRQQADAETAVDAVAEVGNPTILATFTVVAALLPMGFVSGMMGPYMQPIPALGSVAMVFSLLAAFLFTPWLALWLRPSLARLQAAEHREHRQAERLDRLYRRWLLPLRTDRRRGYVFLGTILLAFFGSCALVALTAVPVKMLPYDNKGEFSVIVDLPEGTALPLTASLTHRLALSVRESPEVEAMQTYVGTAAPFNFNGLVRHYYLRQEPWQAEIQVELTDKHHRDRSSHAIAAAARERLQPIAEAAGARIQVVEMPPGPPVLQSVVAEVYGPTPGIRRAVARDLTGFFEEASYITDVDNHLQHPYAIWRFEIQQEKALRQGISVATINRTLEMVMGQHVVGDVKRGSALEPTFIVMEMPLGIRAELARLGELPVHGSDGQTIPLAELGTFVRQPQDSPIFHKDLRPVEYVTGNTAGRLGAPLYGMLEVEDALADYTPPDGGRLTGQLTGPPANDNQSGFEWAGEWTVTYETFRDMGIAFGVALILIYMLVVWQFGNFLLPAIVMIPIPLTLIGILPGHWLLGAQFTATSMIGFIALAGIIVRNSILLVDFTQQEVTKGQDVVEATLAACRTRTRPILITALALVAGSFVILSDPIFEGMAVSLLFGVVVSTALTLVVIPLGLMDAPGALGAQPVPTPSGGPPSGGGGTTPGGTTRARVMARLKPRLGAIGRRLRPASAALRRATRAQLIQGWARLRGGAPDPEGSTFEGQPPHAGAPRHEASRPDSASATEDPDLDALQSLQESSDGPEETGPSAGARWRRAPPTRQPPQPRAPAEPEPRGRRTRRGIRLKTMPGDTEGPSDPADPSQTPPDGERP